MNLDWMALPRGLCGQSSINKLRESGTVIGSMMFQGFCGLRLLRPSVPPEGEAASMPACWPTAVPVYEIATPLDVNSIKLLRPQGGATDLSLLHPFRLTLSRRGRSLLNC